MFLKQLGTPLCFLLSEIKYTTDLNSCQDPVFSYPAATFAKHLPGSGSTTSLFGLLMLVVFIAEVVVELGSQPRKIFPMCIFILCTGAGDDLIHQCFLHCLIVWMMKWLPKVPFKRTTNISRNASVIVINGFLITQFQCLVINKARGCSYTKNVVTWGLFCANEQL